MDGEYEFILPIFPMVGPRGHCGHSGGSKISPRWGRGRQHTIFPHFPKNCVKFKEFGPLRSATGSDGQFSHKFHQKLHEIWDLRWAAFSNPPLFLHQNITKESAFSHKASIKSTIRMTPSDIFRWCIMRQDSQFATEVINEVAFNRFIMLLFSHF